jgi:hypothetical protein
MASSYESLGEAVERDVELAQRLLHALTHHARRWRAVGHP